MSRKSPAMQRIEYRAGKWSGRKKRTDVELVERRMTDDRCAMKVHRAARIEAVAGCARRWVSNKD